MKLLCDERLAVLGRINRWGGWVYRNYSVLEHTVIGGVLLDRKGIDPRPFLLHDFEESEFGDIIAPVKAWIPANGEYHIQVFEFNRRLQHETGVVPDGGKMDEVMAHAEHLKVAIRGDRRFDAEPLSVQKIGACDLIDACEYALTPAAIRRFNQLWQKWSRT